MGHAAGHLYLDPPLGTREERTRQPCVRCNRRAAVDLTNGRVRYREEVEVPPDDPENHRWYGRTARNGVACGTSGGDRCLANGSSRSSY